MDTELAKLIGDRIETQFTTLEESAKKRVEERMNELDKFEHESRDRMEDRLRTLEDHLSRSLTTKIFTIALSVVVLAAGVMLVGTATATREVNSSVIALQKDLISAQTVIRASDESLRKQAEELSKATASLTAKNGELTAASEQLKEERARLEKARTDYEALTKANKAARTSP